MRGSWSSDSGGGGCIKFSGAKKRSAYGKERNILVASAAAKDIKTNKSPKQMIPLTCTIKISQYILTLNT